MEDNKDFEKEQHDTIDAISKKLADALAENEALKKDIIAKNETIRNILDQKPTNQNEDDEYGEEYDTSKIFKKLKYLKGE